MINEHPSTVKVRKKLIQIFQDMAYEVEEEKKYRCKNYIGEDIIPDYKADIYVKLEFNIEIDPDEIHNNSKHNINHDKWKDSNIYNQHNNIRTVRLNPRRVNKQSIWEIMAEIFNQLREKKYE